MSHVLTVIQWNSCLAAGLAVVISLAQQVRFLRNQPHLCHALWLLVLIKLVTPPLFTLPVSFGPASWDSREHVTAGTLGQLDEDLTSVQSFRDEYQNDASILKWLSATIFTSGFAIAFSGLGSLAILAALIGRARAISRLVKHAETGSGSVQEEVAVAARNWNMNRVPSVRVVDSTVSPFLWVSFRRPFIVLPNELIRSLSPAGLRLVIQHELAHYVRRDHLTNAFTTVCVVLFWWNPVVWWARRQLRILQEACCDHMVLARDATQRIQYAETLLQTVDFVGSCDATCPSPATSFGSCKTFKRRIEMIVSDNLNPVRMWIVRTFVVAAALIVLPFGMASAQDYEAIEKRLSAAVEKGEINSHQAKVMMEALRRTANRDADSHKLREGVEHRINEIKKLIESGKLSEEKGARLIEETRNALDGSNDKKQDRDLAAKKRRYLEIARKIKAAVESGVLSKEEAEKKLIAVRKEIFGAPSSDESEAKKRRDGVQYRIREIEKLVKDDKLSREEGAKLIKETKQTLDGAKRDGGKTKERSEAIEYRVKEIEKLVKSGKLSREEGARLIEETRSSQKGKAQQAEDPRVIRYREMQREIEAAVQAGKLTREAAEKKLIETRKKIFKD